jgi:very-short-patch-repair endonuclease
MAASRKQATTSRRGEVLVAILNNKRDFAILKEQGWYRIPTASAPKRWPPRWLAFYQTKVFGEEAFAVNYFGRVRDIRVVRRPELFPDEPPNPKSERAYYRVCLYNLNRLVHPIPSRRLRRIVFIPTTWPKLNNATEINDLFDDSPLEDLLWTALKRLDIPAERQWEVLLGSNWYMLDFALFCAKGKVDVETDGDKWHADRERIPEDNRRNNALEAQGWHILRFYGRQIRESMAEYCLPKIADAVNRLGGMSGEGLVTYHPSPEGIIQQKSLFGEDPEQPTGSQS